MGGVIGMGGIFCCNIDWPNVDIEEKKKTPLFLAHGECDDLFPLEYA